MNQKIESKEMKRILGGIAAAVALICSACGDEPAVVRQRVDVPLVDVVAHDPVIIAENGVYYLFTTGPGVTVWSSSDMQLWTMREPVFSPVPSWAYEEVSEFKGHLWAPDISLRDGVYYLYYSVSSFGSNDSCIGLATNVTLDPASEDFAWVDRGIVLRSDPGLDDWNAIDPNLVFDQEGIPYMAYGSFWSGLKLAELAPSLAALAEPEEEPISIASRRVRYEDGVSAPAKGNDAIEGPFIYFRDGFYYLFASVDFCCRGKDSTYKMIFGRSDSIAGPYMDREGRALMDGGGTLLKQGDERWQGLGHNAVVKLDGIEYAVFHGYDGRTERGLPKLQVQKLDWSEDGWPYLIEAP